LPHSPLVAIVGRPNVGKSTLFNRLTGRRQAITDDQPGVTRDRVYGEARWNGRTFRIVDTGGYVPRSAERFKRAVREQAEIALDEADLVLFTVDVETGVTDLDQELAQMLRRAEKPVLVAVNKVDNRERRWEAPAFWELGLGEPRCVSATNGQGTGDLADAIVEHLPETQDDAEDKRTRIAVIGRPNVGKSLFVNRLVGAERTIVTEVSGTTRDATDSVLRIDDRDVVLVDTAGLRKKARVKENVEFYSTLRTQRAIESCDVAVLLLDATRGLENQDMTIINQANNARRGLVMAINKWDLVEPGAATADDYRELIRGNLRTIDHVPILTCSARTGRRAERVLHTALEVAERRTRRASTARLNEVLKDAIAAHHPPSHKGQAVRIKYVTQVETAPPVFVFFCNHPQAVKDSYKRYLERNLREAFE